MKRYVFIQPNSERGNAAMKRVDPSIIKRSDLIIARQQTYYDSLVERFGVTSAQNSVANYGVACIEWWEKQFGSKAAYGLFQDLVDRIASRRIEPRISARKHDPQP